MPEDAVSGSNFISEILGGMGGGDTSPPSVPSDGFALDELLEELREELHELLFNSKLHELLFDSNPPSHPAPSDPRYAGIEEFISDLLGDGPPATQEQQSTAQTMVEPEWEGNVPPVLTDWGDFLL